MTEIAEESSNSTDGSRFRVLRAVIVRDLKTTIATPTFVLFWAGITVGIVGLALVGESFEAGFTAVALDLLTPVQVVIPLVGFALGYTAIVGDAQRGELDVLSTYPISGWQVVVGTFLARGLGIVLLVGFPLAVVAVLTAAADPPHLTMYATHTGGDSPILFGRFAVLTVIFALVMLALTIAISAVIGTVRGTIAAGATLVLVLILGADLGIALGFSVGAIDEGHLLDTLALSPLSAYRGLVLDQAVVVAPGTGPETANVGLSLASLFGWGIGALLLAAFVVRRRSL